MSDSLTPERHHPPKTLRWHHGFVLALPIVSGLFISMGYTVGAIGAWPAIAIGAGLAIVALLQNHLFAEMAGMFPEKSGGVPLYATEAWKRYFAPIGPLATYGYWCGWALVLSLVGLTVGALVQAQWFPEATWVLFSTGWVDIGLPHLIAAVTVVACTVINVLGINIAVRFNQVIGAVYVVVLALLAIGPFLTGGWDVGQLSSRLDGWQSAMVWLFVSAWAIYGTELCASFAPEYRDTVGDTSKALRSVALFMVFAYGLVPLATTGQLGEVTVTENPITYGVVSVQEMLGGASGLVTAVLCGALFLSMISSSADAGRALYGIAEEDMTIKQFGRLNERGMPGVALWVTMAVNLLILVFVGNPVAILIASNIGYILAITLAVIGFLLLRRDRPQWPRPIKLGPAWTGIAVVIAVFNGAILVIGATNPGLSYAGGFTEVLIGLVLLLSGVLLFVYRRVVQDRGPLKLREETPAMPTTQSETSRV
ncbi:APC family permease [Blastococcus deserti]|uniref:APC family permease n=1 Tax=Blastococcus deserti TaxID=2259033 RepID=A0ABW4XER9_9ACTN